MEESSKALIKDNYPEELNEETTTSICLANMRYVVLDEQTSNALMMMKREVLGNNPNKEIDTKFESNSNEEIDQQTSNALVTIKEVLPLHPPIKALQEFIDNCSTAFEKQLTNSDVNQTQSRLSIPKKHFEAHIKSLMSQEEIKKLKEGNEVVVYDSMGNEYLMQFKIWSGKIHVLTCGWKEFYISNKFVPLDDWITIWVFRHRMTHKLCFVIVGKRILRSKMVSGNPENGD